ncbi:MAG: M48 family metallopeptidase [Akkermansiaceae bacterium]|nr:M48 family metallopeptidase [Armatimonadota bacterium]
MPSRRISSDDDEVRAALDLLWAEFHRLNSLHFAGSLRLDELRLSPRKQYGGYCVPAKRLIVLSLQALREHGFEETLDTFRHEVAHLVHPNHSAAFWEVARKLGSTTRYAKPPKERNPNYVRYVYECPACAATVRRQRRLVRASCAACDKSFNPRYLLRLVSSPALRKIPTTF